MTASYVRQCRVCKGDGTEFSAPAAWLGQTLAVHPPLRDGAFDVQRGRWSITHRESGMAAAHLNCSKRDAIALARQWDDRFSTIDPTDARSWPWRVKWGAVVQAINCPWQVDHRAADGGADDSTDTAAELAATAGLPIDQSGGCRRICWRGRWWPAPTDCELQAWTLDSVCETPDGRSVEPDHPESWLRILRLV